MKNNNILSSKSFYNLNQNSFSYSFNHNLKKKLGKKLSNMNNINKYNNSKNRNKMKIRISHEISTNNMIKSPKYILSAFNNNSFKENISDKLEKKNNNVCSLQFRNKNEIYNNKKDKEYGN